MLENVSQSFFSEICFYIHISYLNDIMCSKLFNVYIYILIFQNCIDKQG